MNIGEDYILKTEKPSIKALSLALQINGFQLFSTVFNRFKPFSTREELG